MTNTKEILIKDCAYCLEKAKAHSKKCHIIPKALEKLRLGVDGDSIVNPSVHKKIPNSAFRKDVRETGNFWCDDCEQESALVDNNFINALREMIAIQNFKKSYNESLTLAHTHSHFKHLIRGIKSIFVRKMLNVDMDFNDLAEYNNLCLKFKINHKDDEKLNSSIVKKKINKSLHIKIDEQQTLDLEKKSLTLHLRGKVCVLYLTK